ncbi:MAG: hypothetical protein F6K17_01760 [Okeania sp. SIO3C4]|nr:hypothetical protein [Okeania sp. SIO3C4]
MEIEKHLEQLDLLLVKCRKKYQEGMDKADKLLAKIREPQPEETEKSKEQED